MQNKPVVNKVEQKVENKPVENTQMETKEYVTIGWIKPVVNKEGEVNQKVFKVEINGIINISTLEKFMDGKVKAIPIKTINVYKE